MESALGDGASPDPVDGCSHRRLPTRSLRAVDDGPISWSEPSNLDRHRGASTRSTVSSRKPVTLSASSSTRGWPRLNGPGCPSGGESWARRRVIDTGIEKNWSRSGVDRRSLPFRPPSGCARRPHSTPHGRAPPPPCRRIALGNGIGRRPVRGRGRAGNLGSSHLRRDQLHLLRRWMTGRRWGSPSSRSTRRPRLLPPAATAPGGAGGALGGGREGRRRPPAGRGRCRSSTGRGSGRDRRARPTGWEPTPGHRPRAER